MKITTTPRELIELGVWEQACEMLGLSVWVVSEGSMPGDEPITLTEDHARELGLIPAKREGGQR